MSDISDLLMKTAIESTRTLARKNGPGERKKSKRGKTTQFYQGLQNASAHTQYLARWSMLGNAKPIPSIKADRGPNDHKKENLQLFHHLSIKLFISKFGFAPFEIPSFFSTAYKVSRCDLRIGLNRSLDPTGRIQRTHQFNQAESGEHFARKGNECLTNHSDRKNCPILDTTISLTTLRSVQDLLCDEVSFADVEKHFDISQGIVAANGIGYTRSCAHNHATMIANIQTALASDTTDDLTKLCIRLLTQTKCPIDYQGFFWERMSLLLTRWQLSLLLYSSPRIRNGLIPFEFIVVLIEKFYEALHVLISMDSIPSFCMFSCHCMRMDSLFQNGTCDAAYTILA